MYREFPPLTLQRICIEHAINIWTEGMMCNDWQLWWMLAIHSSLDRHSFICDQVCRIYWLFDIHTIVTSFFFKGSNIVTHLFFFTGLYIFIQKLQVTVCFFLFFFIDFIIYWCLLYYPHVSVCLKKH